MSQNPGHPESQEPKKTRTELFDSFRKMGKSFANAEPLPNHEGKRPETPQERETAEKVGGITRRVFNRVLAVLGIGWLGKQIVGGGDEAPHEDPDKAESEKTHEAMEKLAREVAEKVKKEHPHATPQEQAMKTVDYLGVGLFAWGIKDLLPKELFPSLNPHGHIHAAHYGALLALSTIKYQLSNAEGKHHLMDETASNAKAFAIISGTIVAAEGLNMDLEKSYEQVIGSKPNRKDKVAVMTMLASVLSPFSTTVGSASIIKKMSNEFAGENQEMMSAFVSHVSNLSGFLLFGDPPFIAICDKYGFKEGVLWQLKTMWPLALYSLVSATFKLNLLSLQKEGVTGAAAVQKAMSDTMDGLKNNVGFLSKAIFTSLQNTARYLGIREQDSKGLETYVGAVLTEKIKNVGKLFYSKEFDQEGHEAHEGMIRGDEPEITGGNEMFAGIVNAFAPETTAEDQRAELRKAIDEHDYEKVKTIGARLQIPHIDLFVEQLKDFQDNAKMDHSADEVKPESIFQKINPLSIYNKITSVNRIKNAVGHNLGDVIDVFPFQAGCVPFLTTAFKDAVSSLEKTKLSQTERELVMFFLIMGFSMVADNYVACKIGLELFPEKPEIPLIASIQGGALTSIGNMANIAQFNLDTFPLLDSIKKFWMHADTVMVNTAWSQAIGILRGLGIYGAAPEVKKKKKEASSDSRLQSK